jgi:hypothetical protein
MAVDSVVPLMAEETEEEKLRRQFATISRAHRPNKN